MLFCAPAQKGRNAWLTYLPLSSSVQLTYISILVGTDCEAFGAERLEFLSAQVPFSFSLKNTTITIICGPVANSLKASHFTPPLLGQSITLHFNRQKLQTADKPMA